jgi:PAS domain S-box-containing protein
VSQTLYYRESHPGEALKTTETLELAAEMAGVGTWLLSLPENELQSSPRCKEVFGLSPEDRFRYEDFIALLHPDDRSTVESAVEHALDPSGTGIYEIDYRIIRPDGAVRWLGGKGKAFFEERDGGRVATSFIGTVLDRTERRKTQDALIEAERFAMTGRLAASIAHEIRNPLNAVLNLLYLARTESSEAERTEYIQQAETELHRISEIASNTLRFYQDPSGTTRLDIAVLAQSVLSLFRGRILASKVRVETELPSGVLVYGIQGELRQVIVNLIGNALDAMPDGGRLILRAREFVNHRTSKPCVRLTIADTGCGMSREVLSRIFEAFYTTKGASGNGLGLWLSLEILKKCGSAMRVRSTIGRGTVFQLSLTGVEAES